ncbi:alginate lyase family protein [Pseudoflavitalea rhizosphaerae]|uniref:alginate lyase family protein n=1 Tax=Pseudoflavitalea rhizosphaerae TaxID=1884793 RepID=UPI001F4966A4|nr:alginate lyase family protein [Pseudoflavitalea rhizosphaerae]
MKHLLKKMIGALCLFLLAMSVQGQQPVFQQVGPGVWKAVIGKPEAYDLLKASGSAPNKAALAKLEKANFPLPLSKINATVRDGKTYLRFPLARKEQLFGFGLNFQTVHQRGKILQLHVDHFGGKDNGRNHAPTPFYVSGNGYGVFINSARYLTVYAGSGVRKDSKNFPEARDRNTDKSWQARPYSDAVEILVPAAGVEVYVFGGPNAIDAVRRFNLFNGGGCLPPRWGLGFTQRVQRLYNEKDVKKEADEFEAKGYPLDFIGLEPGWQSKSYPCTFEWDSTRFPRPAQFVADMRKQHIRVNLWLNPYVSPEASIYKAIRPYTGSHTVWVGAVPDLNTQQGRSILFNQLKKDQVDIGVSGYKIDEVDGYDHYLWPDVATFPSGIAAEQQRQTYGLLMQRYSTEMYKKKNERTFGLVRASNGGGASFPYVIYNDYYNHEDFITALINSGFAGVLWTPEVRASKTGEEWLRRFQTVVFSPMAMINAWASGTKPWSYPEVAEQVKTYATLRMQMMPYWYSEFARYHFEGTPVFRAMNLEEGFTQEIKEEKIDYNLEHNPYAEALSKECKDQYMAGEYLLVAPLFAGQTTRKVILPRGKWYDFYTGDFVGDGEVITVSPGLDKIPVFVKDGGIIPMMPARLHAPAKGEVVNIEVRHYGTKPGSYKLYDDDGETFNYEKGDYSWRTISIQKNGKGELSGSITAAEKGKPNTIGKVSFTFMTKPFNAADLKHKVIETLREQVIREADKALDEKPVTVTASRSPRSAGGPHDFFSEGDYWWPNEKFPDSPYIQKDGMTNPDNFTAHRHAMIRLSRLVGSLASAWLITGKQAYRQQALLHCKAWFVDTATRMNPNLLFAQAIKGRVTGRGIGIIDTIQLMEVVQALMRMDTVAGADRELINQIREWFEAYLQWLTTHQYGKDEMNAANNHGTCWVMQVAAFARFTNNQQLLDFCSERYKTVLLPNQMATDGSFPLELKRTKPYGYSLFNLDAMTMTCEILSTDKNDLWNYTTADGRNIKKSIEYMYPYIADKSKWPFKQDVMYWNEWPVAQPALLFGAQSFSKADWFKTWRLLDHAPAVDEVVRNLPVRNPVIWLN